MQEGKIRLLALDVDNDMVHDRKMDTSGRE